MNKLFNNVSMENIDTQINDPVVTLLVDKFTKLKNYINHYNITATYRLFRKKETKRIIDEIDKILSDRFGLSFKHVATQQTIYATMIVAPGVNTVLDKDRSHTIGEIKGLLRQCETDSECELDKPVADIINFDTDFGSVLNHNLQSIKALEKSMGKGIVVDFEKAKITGMSKDVTFFLLGDLAGLLSSLTLDLKPIEVVAILFHEIGHDFTHIAYSYKKIRNTTSIMESFSKLGSTKDPLKEMKLIAKNELNVDIKSGNTVVATVEFMRAYVSNSSDHNFYSYTDSENLADQFASRFGLGEYLVTSLNHITKIYYVSPFAIGVVVGIMMFAYVLLLTLSVTLALTFGAIGFLIPIILYTILPKILGLFLGSGDSAETTYDNMKDRLTRIRLDYIRQMRENDLPKSLVKSYIKSIDKMTPIIGDYINDKSLFEAVGDLAPWNIEKFTNTRAQQLVEELSENDLHLSKNKLSLLIK